MGDKGSDAFEKIELDYAKVVAEQTEELKKFREEVQKMNDDRRKREKLEAKRRQRSKMSEEEKKQLFSRLNKEMIKYGYQFDFKVSKL